MPNFWIWSAPSAASSTDIPSVSASRCIAARRESTSSCISPPSRPRSGAAGRAGAARRSRSGSVPPRRSRPAQVGARRLRADAEDAALVDVGDRAAARADRVDVDHRHHRLVVADLRVEQVPHAQLAVRGHADVGRRTADVERDDVVVAGHLPAQMPPMRPGHGPGHEQVDRALRRRLDGRHAARGLHELDAAGEARRAASPRRSAPRTGRPSGRRTRSGQTVENRSYSR